MADDGPLAGHPEVAVQRQLPAAVRIVAVDGGDRRRREARQVTGDPLGTLDGGVGRFPHVDTHREGVLAGAGEHRRRHLLLAGVGRRALQR